MSIITTAEIEARIKKEKVKMAYMPYFIRELIVEELEDSEDDAFETGREEGRAELQQEIDDKMEEFVPFEDPDYSHTLFAIDLLQNVTTLEQLQEVKQWLAIQECRSMPVILTNPTFNFK